MKNLYLFTIFATDGKPSCTSILIGDKNTAATAAVQIFDLYRPGARKPISVIDDNKQRIKDLILHASAKGAKIIINDFKHHIKAFDLPLSLQPYNVYDIGFGVLDRVRPSDSISKDREAIELIIRRIAKDKEGQLWQKVYANAAVVYQDLENRGIWNNYTLEKPIWSQKVYSGRSKTLGFNIQGFIEPHYIIQPGAADKELLLHFDWISADIRAAALLSRDQRLEAAFVNSDPYEFMVSKTGQPREQCKILLLKAINSMDLSNTLLSDIYPQLWEWIRRCKHITSQEGGFLETLLERRFKVANAKNDLAVINGAQQGSVAHAMQHTIRRVWERFGHRLIMEGHDSLVVSSPPSDSEFHATIRAVSKLMLNPFEGLLESNPTFPLKVNMGKKWKKWKLIATVRGDGIKYV